VESDQWCLLVDTQREKKACKGRISSRGKQAHERVERREERGGKEAMYRDKTRGEERKQEERGMEWERNGDKRKRERERRLINNFTSPKEKSR
jgi:hypothetical protein